MSDNIFSSGGFYSLGWELTASWYSAESIPGGSWSSYTRRWLVLCPKLPYTVTSNSLGVLWFAFMLKLNAMQEKLERLLCTPTYHLKFHSFVCLLLN